MATQAQREKYGDRGNEVLLPLAVGGDAAAIAVLAERGNTVTVDGKLRKTVKNSQYSPNDPKYKWNTRVVENGKVVEQDGVPTTGNISPF